MLKLSIFLENSRATHELTEERITMGRAADNMIQIDDPSVSGHHAELLLIDERYQLKDVGSTNGTRVNSELVTDTFLRVGDSIRKSGGALRIGRDQRGTAVAGSGGNRSAPGREERKAGRFHQPIALP